MKTGNIKSLSMEYIVYAPAKDVFDALTMPSLVVQWSGEEGMISDQVDGTFKWFGGWVAGTVKKFKPSELLVFTWKPSEWDKKTDPTTVTIKFQPHEAGTKLLLNHEGFPNTDEAEKHKSGWVDFVFEPLNEFFTR